MIASEAYAPVDADRPGAAGHDPVCSGCTVEALDAAADTGHDQPVRYILPNGIPVIIQEHRASDVVALQLWVRAGGRDEASDRARARALPRAHALQGNGRRGRRASSTARSKASAAGSMRGRRGTTPSITRCCRPGTRWRPSRCSRTSREREPRREPARGREAGGPRGDAAERGQPAPVPGPPALRLPPSRAIRTDDR